MSTVSLSLPSSLELVTLEDLAKILHKTPAALYSLLARNKSALPNRVILPGIRRVYFRKIDIEAWISGHIDQAITQLPQPQSGLSPLKRGRGRPRKTATETHKATTSINAGKKHKELRNGV